MNNKTTLWERCALSKLMLVAILVFGGGNLAVAEDDIVIYDGGSTLPTNWTANNSNIHVSDNEIVSIDGAANYITSNVAYSFENRKLVVVAKRTDNTDAYIRISYKNGYSYTTLETIGYGTTCSNSNELYSDDYVEVITGNLTVTNQNLRITAKNKEY